MPPEPNTSVDQIFQALDVLANAEHSVGVAEMARELALPTSTAHRMLVTLEDAGFAGRDMTRARYELGARAHRLVHSLLAMYPIQHAAAPFLARLADTSGETASLDVGVGWVTVRMAGAEGWHEVHAGQRMGETLPLGASAAGLAILALAPAADVDRYLTWEGGGRRAAARTRAFRVALAAATADRCTSMVTSDATGAQLAFSVAVHGRGVAAISLNGSPAALKFTPALLRDCRAIVAEFNMMLDRDDAHARDPFAHVSADELTSILLPAGPPA